MKYSAEHHLTPRRSRMAAVIIIAVSSIGLNLPAMAASGAWTLTGSLLPARDGHTATLLSNGDVVVAGGEGSRGVLASTKIYSPTTGLWTVSGPLAVARSSHNAVLLQSGEVLVAGGCVGSCLRTDTATAELYNAATSSWSKTGSLHTARVSFGMVLLSNGKVLAVGGCTGQNSNGCTNVTATAEIYDPTSGLWTATGALNFARGSFTATLMQNGNVLVAGGINAAGNPIATAEVYNPATGFWELTGAMKVARDEHTATLLPSGKILVAGGENRAGVTSATTELYNPSTRIWTLTGSLHSGRLEHTAVLLPNGTVLVSGGNKVTSTTTTVLSSAEIYHPASGVWSTTGSMHSPRVGHSSTLLQSELVLNVDGSNATTELASAEIYQP